MVGLVNKSPKVTEMKNSLVSLLPVCLALLQPLTTACGSAAQGSDSSKNVISADSTQKKNLVQTLQGDARFSTLVAAVQAADLVDVLSGKDNFTVFAPSNKAFEALPEGTLDSLLQPENKEQLKSILLYHVAAGGLKASEVLKKSNLSTALGQPVSIDAAKAKINGAGIVKTDIIASNGVIHELDAVLLPPSEPSSSADASVVENKDSIVGAKSLTATLAAEPRFSILVAAVQAAGLADTLAGSTEFTVFAPSNKAFEALPAGTVETLLKPENKEQLKAILLYHVAAGSFKATDVLAKNSIATAQGQSVMVDASAIKINNSGIVKTDIVASNGIIHEIDAVLLPPSQMAEKESGCEK